MTDRTYEDATETRYHSAQAALEANGYAERPDGRWQTEDGDPLPIVEAMEQAGIIEAEPDR